MEHLLIKFSSMEYQDEINFNFEVIHNKYYVF